MDKTLFEHWYKQGWINEITLQKIQKWFAFPLFSVYYELQIALWLGVFCLSSGVGTLVYQNIDTIGHQTVLIFICAICVCCFYWSIKNIPPFALSKVKSEKSSFDYILLLGTFSFLSFTGYIQHQYGIFGERYDLALFIPMLALFFIAYRFDNVGILTLAITNLGLWIGVAITPSALIKTLSYDSRSLILSYLTLGLVLLLCGIATKRLQFKSHFSFIYYYYGFHILSISLLSGVFTYDISTACFWLIGLAVFCWLTIKESIKFKSFYFTLFSILFGYLGMCGIWFKLVNRLNNEVGVLFSELYLIGFASVAIYLLIILKPLTSK